MAERRTASWERISAGSWSAGIGKVKVSATCIGSLMPAVRQGGWGKQWVWSKQLANAITLNITAAQCQSIAWS
jgi:hypothetical protein